MPDVDLPERLNIDERFLGPCGGGPRGPGGGHGRVHGPLGVGDQAPGGVGEVPGYAAFDGLDTAGPCPRFPTHRDDPAIWLFSGGTTGHPKAVPQTHGSSTEAELEELAMARLEAYKSPRRVVFAEEMPQTHLGKIDRGKLRLML